MAAGTNGFRGRLRAVSETHRHATGQEDLVYGSVFQIVTCKQHKLRLGEGIQTCVHGWAESLQLNWTVAPNDVGDSGQTIAQFVSPVPVCAHSETGRVQMYLTQPKHKQLVHLCNVSTSK